MTSLADNTALLVMDMQNGIVERYPDEGLLARTADAVIAARSAGIKVFFVRVAFREGHPEISPRNRTFSAIAGAGAAVFTEDDPSTQIHDAVAPQPGEPVVLKRRVSAFA